MVGDGVEIGALVGLPHLLGQGHLGQQGLDALFQREVGPQPWPPGLFGSLAPVLSVVSSPQDTWISRWLRPEVFMAALTSAMSMATPAGR